MSVGILCLAGRGMGVAALGLTALPGLASSSGQAAELLVVEVRLGRHVLSQELNAYQSGDHLLLPLGELARLLTLAVRTEPDQGRAEGFVLLERREFLLDVAKSEVTVAGRRGSFDPGRVQIHPDDIYVAQDLLAQWLPVDLAFNFSTMTLVVRPREPLPLQQRLEREQRGVRAASPSAPADPGYLPQEVPYRLWSLPAVDLALGLDASRVAGRQRTQGQYAALLTGDLLGLESSVFLSRSAISVSGRGAAAASSGEVLESSEPPTPQPVSNHRITLGRNDPDADLLGPLRARSFAFGTVSVPALGNLARTGPAGNGFTISNAPLTQSRGFGVHSLQGDLAPGWDVELYFNGALIGFQQAGSNGRYAFEDVPLLYGANEFRLVFHGPMGQSRTETQTLLLDQSLVQPGDFHYRVAANQGHDGEKRAVAQFDWGLTRHLSVTTGLAALPLEQKGSRPYLNFGLRGSWSSFFLSGNVLRSEDGALAEMGLQTRLGGVRLGMGRTGLTRGFASEMFRPAADPVRWRDRLRLDGAIPLHSHYRLPVSFETRHEQRRSGLREVEAGLRLSASFGGVSLTQLLRWQTLAGVESASGGLQASSHFGGLGVRGAVSYALGSTAKVTTGSLSAQQRLSNGVFLNGSVSRSFDVEDTQYGLSLTKSIGAYGLRLNAGHSRGTGTSLNLQFLMAFAKEAGAGRWQFEAQPMASAGGAYARVFIDHNHNGIEDGVDEPLRNVAFTIDGSRYPARTDAQGGAYLLRLPVHQPVDIGLDVRSLEDPQWSPQLRGVRLMPRPGRIQTLDFPVTLTGEIDGTVQVLDGKRRRGLGGVTLELIDERGRVVGQATTGSDGFYVVQAVPPGTYQLRVARQQLASRGLTDTGRRVVTVSSDAEFLNGVDFDLIPDWGEIRRPAPLSTGMRGGDPAS